jgi:hypothetical protein
VLADTLDAYRRQHGQTGMSRVLFAVEIVPKARRRLLLDRLDGIYGYLDAGGCADHAVARLSMLVSGVDR